MNELAEVHEPNQAVRETSFTAMMTPKNESRIAELAVVAKAFAMSGYFKDLDPKNLMVSSSQALVKILYGQSLGISPAQSISGIYIIENMPSISGALMLALIRKAGGEIAIWEHTEKVCKVQFFRDRLKEDALGLVEWDISKAQKAGLAGKKVWLRYPEDMLFWRVIARGFRRYWSHLTMGSIHTPEELGYFVKDGMAVPEEIPQENSASLLSEALERTPLEPEFPAIDEPEAQDNEPEAIEVKQEPAEEPKPEPETPKEPVKDDGEGFTHKAIAYLTSIYADDAGVMVDLDEMIDTVYHITGNQVFSIGDVEKIKPKDLDKLASILRRTINRLTGQKNGMERVRKFFKLVDTQIEANVAGWDITATRSLQDCISAFISHESSS